MYSVDMDNNRVMIQCNFMKPKYTKCTAVYDTGAQRTCMTALSIDPDLTIDDFKGAETIRIGGIIKNEYEDNAIICYKMPVRDFYLGNIHITGVDIWVTFDDRITDNVVGMDILCRVTRLGIENSNTELFFKDRSELLSYIQKNEQTIRQTNFGLIQDQSSNDKHDLKKVKFTKEDINANYIQKKIEKDRANNKKRGSEKVE